MIYNGTDLSNVFSVYKYTGLLAPSMNTTMWSPTLGDGDRIALYRRPNQTVTASVVVGTDTYGTLQQKIDTIRTTLLAGKDFVPIVFSEVDTLTRYGRVTSVDMSNWYFTMAEYTITFTVWPYRYGDEQTVTGTSTQITGTNAGTAPALGKISFTVSGSPQTLTIALSGTTGAIQLVQPADDTLDGNWIVDLQTRTVYLNGALAMQYLSFENTTFETFDIPVGSYTITFSSSVSNVTLVYEVTYL